MERRVLERRLAVQLASYRQMRFSDRPRPAQLYVISVCGFALALSAFAALSGPNLSAGASPQLFALLVAAATFAHSFPVSTPTKQSYHVSLPFFVAAIIVLSPLQFAALVGVVHIAESVRIRRSSFVQIFNVGTYVVTGLIAQAVYRALWPGQGDLTPDLSQPACLAAGLAAAATFVTLNRVLVSAAIWLANGISPRNQHMFEVESLVTDGILLLMGVPLAHLVFIAPWAAAVGAAPLWLIHRVLDLPNIRVQSRQDGLTELFTAPYLTETCTRELNRGRRFNRPVSLLLLDVDALGQLNAAHGHQTGDVVLRTTARTISRCLREYDLAARLAGSLFAVLLPETDLAQAQIVAERIRRTTADLRHEVPGGVEQVRVTLSVGATVVSSQSATATQLFEAAKAALATAKRGGGNEVAFHAVHAPTLLPVPQPGPLPELLPTRPAAPMQRARNAVSSGPSPAAVAIFRALAVVAVAAIAMGIWMIGVAESVDWELGAVLLCVSGLAGLAFYFKSLPLAVALANELQRSSRLVAARYWRMWPQYVSLGMGALLAIYAYARVGLLGAVLMVSFALVVRHLAGRYVDRTFDSVRKLRNANEALEHQAFHDALTNLPNRALFAERLEHAMVRAGQGSVAVLFLDLDNFKSVNDKLGHAAGDALLIAATERLLDCIRREDTIARLGGDEFTVLLEEMRDPSDAARMAERIAEALCTPFEVLGQEVTVSTSIGIALDTDRSHSPDDLLREADLAMYRAKFGGKARYEIFDTNIAEQAAERLGLETELRDAVAGDQLELHYARNDGAPGTFEASLRWRHPRLGLLEAGEFMRVAEETGAVVELGRWMLERGCRDARDWQQRAPGVALRMSVSARLLEQPRFGTTVSEALAEAGLAPDLLHLAVEAPALGSDQCCAAAAEIVDLGVHMAVIAGDLRMSVARLQHDREQLALRAA